MRRVLLSAVALVMVGGCYRPAKPPPPAPLEDANKPIFARVTSQCAPKPGKLPVVKIRITDVSPKNLQHDTALFESNDDGTRSSDKRLKDIPEVVLEGENPTRLDIDANDFLKKEGDQLLVEIELADAAATFRPGRFALTSGNADGAAMFCVRKEIDAQPGDRIARFYVQYVKSGRPLYGKYNLFVLVKDGPYTTPVVLDPKVHNLS